MDFKIGDVYQDAGLLKKAEKCVEKLLAEDEELALEEHRALRAYVEKSFGEGDFRTI